MSLPAPYYQDDAVTIYHGDCLEIAPQLGRFDAVITDPPYGKVKGTFDHEWTNRPAMLKSAGQWAEMAANAMKSNATLFWFAWPSLAGRIEALLAERLNPIAHLIWKKPTGLHQKHSPEILRAPAPETERILMAEHYGADNMALGESGYAAKCDELRGFVFEPLRKYLDDERIAAGLTPDEVNVACGFREKGGMAGRHWFNASQFAMPTKGAYERIAKATGYFKKPFEELRREFEELRREFEELRREFEELRREFEELRRYFKLEPGDPKTEIWEFPPARPGSGHPTAKPLALMSFMVRVSVRPGGTILDPFAGSGTTGRAAKDLGRKAVLIEKDESYCELAAGQMAQDVLQFI